MNIYIKLFHISIQSLVVFSLNAQISLDNPSLEGTPADATIPSGWFAASKGTTPDILPGFWGVYNEANDGETYVGLIVRPDDSFESIGQRLKAKVEKNNCYKMSLNLAHSDTYTGYNDLLGLRIWIGSKKSKREQLIYDSGMIESDEWEIHKFEFQPIKNMQYIILEAYKKEGKKSYRGNILIDDISTIVSCDKA